MPSQRTIWATLSDGQLLAQCDIDTYRASGPGGQKRNKTSSAVRLRHGPSGLIVIAEESRSQHENKAKALQRLRRAFWLELREPINLDPLDAVRTKESRIIATPRSPHYLPAVAVALDVLESTAGVVREAAAHLTTSTANLLDFLRADDRVWRAANQLRTRHGHTPLHD